MRGRLLLLVALAAGCGDDNTPWEMGTAGADQAMSIDLWQPTDLSVGDLTQPDLVTSGCTPPPFYPPLPYGYRVGRVLGDLMFQGKHDDNGNGRIDSGDTVTTISMHDYFQNSTNQLLVIVAGAVWCQPCNQEQPGLVTLYGSYHPRVSFLTALLQNQNHGPPTMTNVNVWGSFYKVPYDMVIDPTQELLLYDAASAFPMQMLVRTSDMQILWIDNGSDSSKLQAAIDAALAALPDGGAPAANLCDLGGTTSGPVDAGSLDYCDTCTSDGECPTDAVCATDIHGGRYCGKRCAVDLDCPQNVPGYPPFETCVADPGGKGNVCRPIAGACHGAGNVCDWCRKGVATDCGSGLICAVLSTGEHLCSESCTVDVAYDPSTGIYSFSNDTCPSGSQCDLAWPPLGGTNNGACGGDPTHQQLTCQFAPQD